MKYYVQMLPQFEAETAEEWGTDGHLPYSTKLRVDAINTNLRFLSTLDQEALDNALDDIFTTISRVCEQYTDRSRAIRRIGGETYHSDGRIT